MRYDMITLNGLRYPTGDESLVDICRVLAISDASLQVNALVGTLKMGREFFVDVLSPDADIVTYVKRHRPDVIMLSTDTLDEMYLTEMTMGLDKAIQRLPALVTVGSIRDDELERLLSKYRGRLHITAPVNPFFAAEELRSFILHFIVSREYYRTKLRDCCELTLLAMGADRENYAGFEIFTEGAMAVLENPYIHFDLNMLVKEVTARKSVSRSKVTKAFDEQLEAVRKNISEKNRKIAFKEYLDRDVNPGTIDIFYAAAKLTSGACKLILEYMKDLPEVRRTPNIKVYNKLYR